MKSVLFKLLALLSTISGASAAIEFTFTATANNTAGGYIANQSYSFVFTLADDFPSNSSSSFDSISNNWSEEVPTLSTLWTSVSGSGLTGSFTPPLATFDNNGMTASSLVNYSPLSLIHVEAGDTYDSGLKTLDGTVIRFLTVDFQDPTGLNFTTSGTYSEPSTYFNNYLGTYADPSGANMLDLQLIDQNHQMAGDLSFTATGLTIAQTSAVPEPSTYAALAGVAMLGFASWRRRKVARAVTSPAAI